MKALTIKQPWADLIIGGSKRVENRSWRTKHRGMIAVHAGVDRKVVKAFKIDKNIIEQMSFGAVIGTVTVMDCVEIDTHTKIPILAEHRRKYPWLEKHGHTHGPFCWVLEDPTEFSPVPAKGALGLWEWNV